MNGQARAVRSAVLVIEDARSDRARFRLLMARHERRNFEFAWRWPPDGRGTVGQWFREAIGTGPTPASFRTLLTGMSEEEHSLLRRRIGAYSAVMLDLAWTGRGEQVMQTWQHFGASEGVALAADPDPTHPLFEVEGIALLEWLLQESTKEKLSKLPRICVTSAYVAETALGIRTFLRSRYATALGIEILHKWMDEESIWNRLGEATRE